MGSLFISLLTLVLILISAFVVLLVLMQRTSQSGGMGAALGGGAAESAFGSETTNVLTKATIYSTIAFFIVSLGLFLIYQSKASERIKTLNPEELISASESDSGEPESVADNPAMPSWGAAATLMKNAEEGLTEAADAVEAVTETLPTEVEIPTVEVEVPVFEAEAEVPAVEADVEAPAIEVEIPTVEVEIPVFEGEAPVEPTVPASE